MKGRPSRQQEIILTHLRSGKWVCGREWLNQIKDDRARISNLNEFYMKARGYKIAGEPCKGEICGVPKCPLFKRQAQKLNQPTRQDILKDNAAALAFFDNYQPTL